MDSKIQEKFQAEYNTGKDAFERGEYRLALQHLEAACQLAPLSSRQGGDARIWLVTTYQAAGKLKEAIALAGKLCAHPNLKIRQQSQRLLYIIEAPKLRRPREWTVEMPEDTSNIAEENYTNNFGKNIVQKKARQEPKSFTQSEPFDLDRVNNQDNRFIWVAILAIVAVFGGLFWLG